MTAPWIRFVLAIASQASNTELSCEVAAEPPAGTCWHEVPPRGVENNLRELVSPNSLFGGSCTVLLLILHHRVDGSVQIWILADSFSCLLVIVTDCLDARLLVAVEPTGRVGRECRGRISPLT
jgi:hypothetical protein